MYFWSSTGRNVVRVWLLPSEEEAYNSLCTSVDGNLASHQHLTEQKKHEIKQRFPRMGLCIKCRAISHDTPSSRMLWGRE